MGLEPDCVTCAKGISGAYMPIAGIIMGEEFNRRLDLGNEAKGWFAHGGTHHAHAVSAAVAVEVLNIFERRDILGHVRRVIPHWNRMLDSLLDHPLVVGNRKFGLLGAIEVAAARRTRRRLGLEPQGRRIEQDDLRSGARDRRDRAPPRRLPRAVAAPHHHGSGDRRARTQVEERVRSGSRRHILARTRGVCRGPIAQGRGCAVSRRLEKTNRRRRQTAQAMDAPGLRDPRGASRVLVRHAEALFRGRHPFPQIDAQTPVCIVISSAFLL